MIKIFLVKLTKLHYNARYNKIFNVFRFSVCLLWRRMNFNINYLETGVYG